MIKTILLAILSAVLAAACSGSPGLNVQPPEGSASTLTPLPHSMKGYELYSWQVDDQWHFTLVTGSNRSKTVEEITAGEDVLNADGWTRLSVQGPDALKSLLGRLPAGEEIYWAGELPDSGITLPPQDVIDIIQEYARMADLQLMVSE